MQNSTSQKMEKVTNFRDHMRKEWYRPPIRPTGKKRVSMQSLPKESSCIRTLKEYSKPWESKSHPPIHRHEHLSSDGINGTNKFLAQINSFNVCSGFHCFTCRKKWFCGSIFQIPLIFHGNFQLSLEQQQTIGNIVWLQSSERRIRTGV